MRVLPRELRAVRVPFAPLFSRRVFEHALVLLVGMILVPGRRTVTAALRVMGQAHCAGFHRSHRVLSRATWSPRQAARVLLKLLLESFAPTGPLVFGIDDTIERR